MRRLSRKRNLKNRKRQISKKYYKGGVLPIVIERFPFIDPSRKVVRDWLGEYFRTHKTKLRNFGVGNVRQLYERIDSYGGPNFSVRVPQGQQKLYNDLEGDYEAYMVAYM